MRAPIRSESDAFRLTWLTAVVAGLSLLLGWLTAPLVGVTLFVLLLLTISIAYVRAPDPDRRSALRGAAETARARRSRSERRHLLVVDNETLAGRELRDRILGSGDGRVEVDILAPVLTSRVHLGVTDIDRKLDDARERLRRSLAWAREQRIHARGEIGSTSPVIAIEDELRAFGADEVIVVTHPRERETWQERDELERLRGDLDLPVMHVVVGDTDS
jgi:hypothetical protein